MILDGVHMQLGIGSELEGSEFDGVEEKANLWAPRACPPPLEGLRPGSPGQQEGVDACSASGVAALYRAEQASGLIMLATPGPCAPRGLAT